MYKTQVLIIFTLFCSKTYSQGVDLETLYNFNNKVSESRFYLTKDKFKCALNSLKELESSNKVMSNKIMTSELCYSLANLYLKIGDSALTEKYYIEYLKTDFNKLVLEISNNESKFNFIYKKHKSTFDTAIVAFITDINLQRKLSSYNESLSQMVTLDQFVRVTFSNLISPMFVDKDTILGVFWHKVDSINSSNFSKLIDKDKNCDIIRHNFTNYYILSLHLSRLDTSTFIKIISYNARCMGTGNRLSISLADNRSQVLHNKQSYYTYLLPSMYNTDLDFKKIDAERKKAGLPSLYYDLIMYGIKLPIYYYSFERKFLTCYE